SQWRRRECLESERFIDPSLALFEEREPRLVARSRIPHEIGRLAAQVGDRFLVNLGIADVVAAPVETDRPVRPFRFAAPPEPGPLRAELEHRDLVRVDIPD